jgi:hypothetical protein
MAQTSKSRKAKQAGAACLAFSLLMMGLAVINVEILKGPQANQVLAALIPLRANLSLILVIVSLLNLPLAALMFWYSQYLEKKAD